MKLKTILFLFILIPSFSFGQIISSVGIKYGLLQSSIDQSGPLICFGLQEDYISLYTGATLGFFNFKYFKSEVEFGFATRGDYREFKYNERDISLGFMASSLNLKFKYPLKSLEPFVMLSPGVNFYPDLINNEGYKEVMYNYQIGVGVDYIYRRHSFGLTLGMQRNFDNFFESARVADPTGIFEQKVSIKAMCLGFSYAVRFVK